MYVREIHCWLPIKLYYNKVFNWESVLLVCDYHWPWELCLLCNCGWPSIALINYSWDYSSVWASGNSEYWIADINIVPWRIWDKFSGHHWRALIRIPTRELNQLLSMIWLLFVHLLVFFDSQARVSLLGEVNRAAARLITRGFVVLRLRDSFLWIWSRIGVSRIRQIDSYLEPFGRSGTQAISCGIRAGPLLRGWE